MANWSHYKDRRKRIRMMHLVIFPPPTENATRQPLVDAKYPYNCNLSSSICGKRLLSDLFRTHHGLLAPTSAETECRNTDLFGAVLNLSCSLSTVMLSALIAGHGLRSLDTNHRPISCSIKQVSQTSTHIKSRPFSDCTPPWKITTRNSNL